MPVDAVIYPVSLILQGRRCLVVGGGTVAERKVKGLLAAGAKVHVISPELCGELRSLVADRAITHEERPYHKGDVAGYRLVVAATGDPAINRSVYEDGETAGIWVNAADDTDSCSFYLPAVARQGVVTVAVSTAGCSPALASWLRSELAGRLPPELAEFAEFLAEARAELKAAGRSTEDVDWRPVLDWYMIDLIRKGLRAEAKERLEACLSS